MLWSDGGEHLHKHVKILFTPPPFSPRVPPSPHIRPRSLLRYAHINPRAAMGSMYVSLTVLISD